MKNRTVPMLVAVIVAAAGWAQGAWAEPLDLDDLRVVYGQSAASSAMKSQVWDDSLGSWTASTLPVSADTGQVIYWAVHRISPKRDQEFLAFQEAFPSTSGTEVKVKLFSSVDGTTWNPEASVTPTIIWADRMRRAFDLEFEGRSGKAVFVCANNTSNPQYWIWNDALGKMESKSNVFSSPPFNANVKWVELVPRPGTDEILLLYSDGSNNLVSRLSKGAATGANPWVDLDADPLNSGIQYPLTGSLIGTQMRAFDAAYEASSGQVLLVYGMSGSVNNKPKQYRTLDRASDSYIWTSPQDLTGPTKAVPIEAFLLSPEPKTDSIAAASWALNAGNPDIVGAGMWDGNVWVDMSPPNGKAIVELDTPASQSDDGEFRMAVGWLGTSGVAILTYADGAVDGLNWAKWQVGEVWVKQFPNALTLLPVVRKEAHLIHTFYNQDKALVAFTDADAKLWAVKATYNAAMGAVDWAPTKIDAFFNPVELDTSMRTESGPFGFSINRYTLPSVSLEAGNIQLPVGAASSTAPLPGTLKLTDAGGVIDSEEPLNAGQPSYDIDTIKTQDIELRIPAGLELKWATDQTVCVGGTAGSKVKGTANASCPSGRQATVTYLNGDKTVAIDVTTPFASGDTLELSGLQVVFEASAVATAAGIPLTAGFNVRPDLDSTTDVDETKDTAQTIQLVESLLLGLPASQVVNAFTQIPSIPQKELLRVALTARGGHVRLTELSFGQSLVGTLTLGPFQVKDEATGTVHPATPQAGLAFSALPSACDASGVGPFCIAKDQIKTFLLLGAASGLDVASPVESATLSLASGGGAIKAVGMTTGLALQNPPLGVNAITGGPVQSDPRHTVSSYVVTVSPNPIDFQVSVTIDWLNNSNVSDPTKFEYKVGTDPWVDLPLANCPFTKGATSVCGGTATRGGATSCLSNIPTNVRADTNVLVRVTGKELTDCQDIVPAVSSPPLIVEERLQFTDPGQPPNAFTATGALTDRNLLSVTLAALGGDVNLNGLSFTVTPVVGSVALSSYRLVDSTGAVVSGPQATPDFNNLGIFLPLNMPKTYTLQADASGLDPGESLMVSLAPTGITSSGAITSATVDAELVGSPLSKTHTVSSYAVVVSPTPARFQEALTISWTKSNMGEPTKFEYSLDGKPATDPTKTWTNFTGAPGGCTAGMASPCSTSVPTSVGAAASAMIRLTGNENTDNQSVSSVSPAFNILERLVVEPPATQVPNNFRGTGDLPSPVELLKVTLKANGGAVNVTGLSFTVTQLTGNGVTLSSYSLEGPDGTFSSASPAFTGVAIQVTAGSPETYTLKASVSGLDPGDSLELKLEPALSPDKLTATGAVTSEPISSEGTAVSKIHTVSAYVISAPKSGDTAIVGAPWTITWESYGDASPDDVTVSYRKDSASPWTTLSCAPLVAGSCTTIVPDDVSTTAAVKVSDNTKPIERISEIFTIGGVVDLVSVSAIDLNGAAAGGETWIVGKSNTITWTQVGSFSTVVEFMKDATIPSPVWKQLGSPVSLTWTPLNPNPVSTTYTAVFPDDVTSGPTAKVRSRPELAVQTTGNRESSLFAVQPAFSAIDPGSSTLTILKNTSIDITWTRLLGTEPGASGFPIDNVTIRFLDSGGTSILPSITAANSGSLSWQTLDQGFTDIHIKICDLANPGICADGGAFDVVDLSVSVAPDPGPEYRLGNQANITWGVGLKGNVKLTLRDLADTTLLDVRTLPASALNFTWDIPTTLSAPLSDVHIHLEDAANPAVFADSSPFTIHGVLKNLTVSPTPVKTEKLTQPDPDNDVTISWQAIGANTVKLWLSKDGGPYTKLSSFGATGADSVTGSSYAWTNVNGSAKSPNAKIKVTQVGDESLVFTESAPFAIVGELQVTQPTTGASFDISTTYFIEIIWLTPRGPISPVRLRILDLDNANAVVFEKTLPNSSTDTSPQTEPWTPTSTYANLQAEVCDTENLTVCARSGVFTVKGLDIVSPAAAQRFVIDAGGATIPIQWKPVGGSGTVQIDYLVPGKSQQPIRSSVTSQNDTVNTLSPDWALPETFADLSDQVSVIVTDSAAGLVAQSSAFTIAGKLIITDVQPAGPYEVDQSINLFWNVYGAMTSAKLQYSTNGGTSWTDGPSVDPSAKQLLGWTIPVDAISQALQLRLIDTTVDPFTGAHPASESPAFTITVTPKLTLTLPDPSPWVANEQRPIQWNATGLIDKVQLLYSVNGGPFLPMTGTPQPNGMVCNGMCNDDAGDPNWSGSFTWTVADPILSRDPTSYASTTVVVKVVDASQGHVSIERPSNPVDLIYLKVVWQVMDLTTQNLLAGLNVNELSFLTGLTTWSITDASLVPNSPTPPGILRYYPKDQYTTTWTMTGASEAAVVAGWEVDRTLLVDFDGVAGLDPTKDGIVKKAFLELDVNKQLPWNVEQRFEFVPGVSPAPDSVLILGWLEKRGILFDLVSQMDVEIRTETQVIKTLSSTTPDPTGVFRLSWDLMDDAGNPVDPNAVYYAKATITTATGATLTSGEALAMAIPKKILAGAFGSGVSLTELQTELTPIKTDVGEVKTAVTTTLPDQITAAQTAIQTDIATAKTELGTKVDAVKTDTAAIKLETAAIKAETDKISAEVIPGITGVRAYLEDPNAGLPKVLENQTTMKDQLKAQRRGGILNRDMELEVGESATIQYRAEGGAPSLNVYDGLGAPVAVPPLLLNSTTGLYESTFSLAALGQYRAVVTEPASTDSAGTLDSITLTLRTPVATAQAVGDINTLLTNLDDQVSAMTTKLDTEVIPRLTTIEGYTDQVEGFVDQLEVDTQALLLKWGALDAASLMTELDALATALGTPPLGSSIAQELGIVKTAADTAASEAGAAKLAADAAKVAAEAANLKAGDLKTAIGADVLIAAGVTLEQLNTAATLAADNAKTAADTAASEAGAAKLAAEDLKTVVGADALIARAETLDLLTGQAKTAATDAKTASEKVSTAVGADALIARAETLDLLTGQAKTAATDAKTASEKVSTAVGADALLLAGTTLERRVGTPTAASLAVDLSNLKGVVDGLTGTEGMTMDTVKTRFDELQGLIEGLPNVQVADQMQRLTEIADQLTALEQDLLDLGAPAQDPAVQNVLTQLAALKETVEGLPTEGLETDTLLGKLDDLNTAIQSAQGSSAAVGLSQSAFAAASEAVEILRQLQTEVRANGAASPTAPVLLGQLGEKLTNISSSVTMIPGQLTDEELSEQLKAVAERMKALSTDNGYNFDSLYEMTETQAGDVKTVRNRVEELKALLEVQRALLEKGMNQPIVKTWFEAR